MALQKRNGVTVGVYRTPEHDAARDAYKTRSQRNPKGQSRVDVTAYDVLGRRRPGNITLRLRQEFAQMASKI